MPWAYILQGSSGRHYFGSTTKLLPRLEQHGNGHTHSNRRLGETLELIAALGLGTAEQARPLEMKQKKIRALRCS